MAEGQSNPCHQTYSGAIAAWLIASSAMPQGIGRVHGSAVAATNDNRKTYNTDNSTSFSFAGATFQIRSEQDVRDLAVEIATLTRRNQRGRGLRMA